MLYTKREFKREDGLIIIYELFKLPKVAIPYMKVSETKDDDIPREINTYTGENVIIELDSLLQSAESMKQFSYARKTVEDMAHGFVELKRFYNLIL